MRGWLDTEIIFAAIDRVHGVPHEFESTLTMDKRNNISSFN